MKPCEPYLIVIVNVVVAEGSIDVDVVVAVAVDVVVVVEGGVVVYRRGRARGVGDKRSGVL